MSEIYGNIAITLDRADEILVELLAEYERSLRAKEVSPKVAQLTHDVCEKLRSALDRIARRYWETHVAQSLGDEDRAKADIYFPVAANQGGLDSTLGRWRWKSVKENHQPVYDYLLAQQPFTSDKNKWMAIIADLAVQGKHVDLVPQKRFEDQRVTIASAGGGSVSWVGNIRFGKNVSVMGAPIDPQTQRIVPTPGVTEKIESWVGILIEGYTVSADGLCKLACRETRRIVQEMTDKFALS
jgi:hypothetical protein